MSSFMVVIGVIFLIALRYLLKMNDKEVCNSEDLILDVGKFSRLSLEELVNINGKAEKIEKWIFKSPNGNTYQAETLYYENNKLQFLVIDNFVVRLNIFSEKYNTRDGKSIEFKNDSDILKLLVIKPSKGIKKVANTNLSLRYQLVSDKIADVWIPIMDKKQGTLDEIKITYDLDYF